MSFPWGKGKHTIFLIFLLVLPPTQEPNTKSKLLTKKNKTMKLLYFRVGTATATEDDEATGSNVYPVENFMGAFSGTYVLNSGGSGDDVIDDDDDAITVFLKPIRKTQTDEGQVNDADPDIIILACAQYGQKALIRKLLSKVNGGPHDDNFITLFDGYVDKPASAPTSDVGATGLTIVAAQVAAD